MKPKPVCFWGMIVFFLCSLSYGQDGQNSRIYEIRSNIAVVPCYITGKRIYKGDEFATPPLKAKFALIRPLNSDTFVLRYLQWVDPEDSVLKKYYNEPLILDRKNTSSYYRLNAPPGIADSLWNDPGKRNDALTDRAATGQPGTDNQYESTFERYFLISRYDLDSNCVKLYNRGWKSAVFTIGLVTMPLKLRLGSKFDFQGNLSLGTTAGVKIRLSKYNSNFINLLLGTAISTITLDSSTTKGRVVGQPLNNIAVVSPSLGAVFEFGRAQAGIFYGWDFLNKSTQSRYEWIYNKKPWFSIGFGFSIFNIDGKSESAHPETQ